MTIYITLFVVGIICIVLSANFFVRGTDFFANVGDRFNLHISTTELNVPIVGGQISVNVAKNDRIAAWRIYTQLSTRVAAVDFDDSHDSALLVHQSLHKAFEIIREEISNIPVDRIRNDRSDNTVRFYMDILNEGIRPHLSKWHIPLQKFIENEQKKHPELSVLQIEHKFPQYKELVASLKAMNGRMQGYSASLLKIAKASR